MFEKKLFVTTAILALLCTDARAEICNGPITSVAVQNDGTLLVRSAGRPHWALCNINLVGTYGGEEMQPTVCRGWQALLMAAQKAGTTVSLYTRSRACSDILDWQQAGVYYIEDIG
jgi:hypothetical protein